MGPAPPYLPDPGAVWPPSGLLTLAVPHRRGVAYPLQKDMVEVGQPPDSSHQPLEKENGP